MNKFTTHSGLAVPLYRANIDTDQIIPKQFLKSIKRTGFADGLFYDWRYTSDGEADPTFVLNMPRYRDATILITGKNFGCGSSREHAPWALAEFGFRAIIAPSFADIFHQNAIRTGILPVVLYEDKIEELVSACMTTEGYKLTIDLECCEVREPEGLVTGFEIDEFDRFSLLNGLDTIGHTLQHEEKISSFETASRSMATAYSHP